MDFHQETIREINALAKDNKWAFFFDNMEEKRDNTTDELIEKIAIVAMKELGIDYRHHEKVEFFIRLGYFSCNNNG